jgi:thymidylate synthase (FAD)
MKIISPKVEFITEKNPLKRIELVARVCWGTESKITETSARPFCEKLLKMGHTSPFEHARVTIPMEIFLSVATLGTPYGYYNRYTQILYNGKPCVVLNCRDFLAIGGNLDAIEQLDLATDFATACFTVDIGISRELVRHRQFSFMERSTRYVNMKDGIEFIAPIPFDWAEKTEMQTRPANTPERFVDYRYQTWFLTCEMAEWSYQALIDTKCPPQEARNVLPLSTATKLYVTGIYSQWHDMLKLRTDKAAHPQMQYAMKLMLENKDCPTEIKKWEV